MWSYGACTFHWSYHNLFQVCVNMCWVWNVVIKMGFQVKCSYRSSICRYVEQHFSPIFDDAFTSLPVSLPAQSTQKTFIYFFRNWSFPRASASRTFQPAPTCTPQGHSLSHRLKFNCLDHILVELGWRVEIILVNSSWYLILSDERVLENSLSIATILALQTSVFFQSCFFKWNNRFWYTFVKLSLSIFRSKNGIDAV